MKYIKSIIISLSVTLVLMSCADPAPQLELTAEEKQINLLAKTWGLGSVELGSVDVTNLFSGFTLDITKNKTFTTTANTGGYDRVPFEPSGNWDFKSGNLEVIDRSDGVVMDIKVTENSLTLIFIITEEGGRIAGIGEYRFALVPQ